MDITHFGIFILSIFLLCITPGPDLAYVIGQSVTNGRRAGVISSSGIALGSCTHAIAGAIGLTALIAASPLLFTIIKYLGAAYLIFLGTKMLWNSIFSSQEEIIENKVESRVNVYNLLSKGYITTLINPKVLLFFIAFFPQFVDVNGTNHTLSFLILGFAYAAIGFIVDAAFAILAGGAAGAVAKNNRLKKLLDRIVGTAFIGLGIRLALVKQP